MGFLGVYRAVYDYAPNGEGELEITEGDMLFVLEKSSEDDWWKAKKKANSDDDDEPEGLIPSNYIEAATPTHSAKALYDYTQQTDEEISFPEEAQLEVYDTSDPDWTLVGHGGAFGFAPAIYIEIGAGATKTPAPTAPAMPSRPEPAQEPEEEADSRSSSPARNPAKALAGIIAQRTGGMAPPPTAYEAQPASPALPTRPTRATQYTPDESEDDAPPPPMPQRPRAAVERESDTPPLSANREPPGVIESPPYNRAVSDRYDNSAPSSGGGGYKLFAVHEMVSSLGKSKKLPTTLGVDLARGMISISPAKAKDGLAQEWTADRLSHYSIESKHVFMELVRPSKSVDFHAGAKDTAAEIVSMLGELAGAARAEGLKEVIAASAGSSSTGQKTGHMLYEFMAQGDDEVTVATGDEVIILDDTKSDDWWMIRRLKNGKEGVVPSSYVEVTGSLPVPQKTTYASANGSRSTVEQNRLDEQRLTREAASRHRRDLSDTRNIDDGNGLHQPPARESSLSTQKQPEEKRHNHKKKEQPKSKPNSTKTRTWTDRSGAFRVEAEFLGLKDNKIHLHKDNGVKIAVPVGKMAVEDLEYVESVTGVSLDEDKPLSDIKRRSMQKEKDRQSSRASQNGISTSKPPDYDWFDFFLACGVNPQICERYAQNFSKDEMGEEILPDVTPALLRTLGLKEGDILRVMKHLDQKFGRANGTPTTEGEGSAGGLFSGPGGALKNNTRKGRPAPAVSTNDVVSADGLRPKTTTDTSRSVTPVEGPESPEETAPTPPPKGSGFDDDAWSVKPSKSSASHVTPASSAPSEAPSAAPAPTVPALPASQAPKLTGSMGDLSLLSPALEPARAEPSAQQSAAAATPVQQQGRPTADATFFDKLGAPAQQNILAQPTGRARPQAPPLNTDNAMIAPPPRSASAPGFQQPQQSGFAAPTPLSAQMTGYQYPMNTGFQAPNGQSLQSLQQQQAMMANQQFQHPQQLAYQQTGFQPNMLTQQQTGFYPQQQVLNFQPTGSPFADSARAPFNPQPTGFAPPQQQQPQFTSPNSMLPPALTPMRTGMAPSPMNGYGGMQQPPPQLAPQQTGFQPTSQFGQQQQQQQQQQQFNMIPPQQLPPGYPPQQLPPQQTGMMNGFNGGQQQQQMQPLQPQKTGPPPPVRFGSAPALKPLVATPTGRRANLSNATPQNPFGF